jgi:signal transduction histidine kinase
MSDEPENFTLALLRKIDAKVDSLREEMATKSDVADVRSEVHSLRADVGSDIMNLEKQIKELEKRLSDQIVGLRRSVMEYHSSTIGHGVLLTEFEERLRRLEEHVGLTPEGH